MRQPCTFFLSYAHANGRLAADIERRMREQMVPSLRYEYKLWRDTALLVGEDWDQEIRAALDECHVGLLALSPAFLGSEYIKRVELPALVGNVEKPVVPVLLEPIDFVRHDLAGLGGKQAFGLKNPGASDMKAYADCDTRQRRQFAEQLFSQIEQRLDKIFAAQNLG
jgi:hypothetical protein